MRRAEHAGRTREPNTRAEQADGTGGKCMDCPTGGIAGYRQFMSKIRQLSVRNARVRSEPTVRSVAFRMPEGHRLPDHAHD